MPMLSRNASRDTPSALAAHALMSVLRTWLSRSRRKSPASSASPLPWSSPWVSSPTPAHSPLSSPRVASFSLTSSTTLPSESVLVCPVRSSHPSSTTMSSISSASFVRPFLRASPALTALGRRSWLPSKVCTLWRAPCAISPVSWH